MRKVLVIITILPEIRPKSHYFKDKFNNITFLNIYFIESDDSI